MKINDGKKQISLYISDAEFNGIEALEQAQRRTKTEIVREAIREYLKQKSEQRAV